MLPKTIADYGGPYVDKRAVSNPQSELAASKVNRAFCDTSQMTATSYRAIVKFLTNTSTNPPSSDVTHWSVWGSGSSTKPTIERTGVGLYTVTYATSFVDELGVTETVSFSAGHVSVIVNDNNFGFGKVKSIGDNVIDICLHSASLTDFSGAGYAVVWLR